MKPNATVLMIVLALFVGLFAGTSLTHFTTRLNCDTFGKLKFNGREYYCARVTRGVKM